MHKQARLGLIGCVVAGMIIGSMYSLLPAYYVHLGYNDNEVANWMILLIASGVIAQYPMGLLADKYGKLGLLLIEIIITMITCLMLLFDFMPIVSIIILGAAIYTVYPIAMAWACETVRKQDIVAMNQTMLLINTLGSLIAPTIIAITMDQFGHHYLLVLRLFHFILFGYCSKVY